MKMQNTKKNKKIDDYIYIDKLQISMLYCKYDKQSI
jgi:hypothetical protein